MDRSTFEFIRVKLKFRTKGKLVKLDRRVDKSFSSMVNLRKMVFKSFPEIEEIVEGPSRSRGAVAPMQLLEVKCKDDAGDYITIEGEDDLDALELSQRNDLEFQVDVIPVTNSVQSFSTVSFKTQKSAEQLPSRKDKATTAFLSDYCTKQGSPKQVPCRFFQAGNCKNGQTCRFSHDLAGFGDFQVDVIPVTSSVQSLSPVTFRNEKSVEQFPGQKDKATTAFLSDYSMQQSSLKQVTCRYFQAGNCKNGQTCRFSHDLAGSEESLQLRSSKIQATRKFSMAAEGQHSTNWPWSHPSREEVDYTFWLKNQVRRDAVENIEYLSGETGLQMLSTVVEKRELPDETINLFVNLLVKDEIRSSLLRQKTNKIYGVLLGSRFLLQLHVHITRQFGIHNPKPQDVRPYVLLIEELQLRTTDGWKEVPLDAMQSAVSKLEENTGKADLLAVLNRLIEHREKLQRSSAVVRAPDRCLQGEIFRQMPIVASKEELFQARRDLPVNRVGIRYSTVLEYLETHFQLLREDCVEPLRQGIRAYRSSYNDTSSSLASRTTQELRIYSRVQLVAVRCGDSGVEYVLSFHLPAGENVTQQYWESSKRLMLGALLCISSDQFQTFFWGVVARRDVKDLAKGLVAIRIIGESEANVNVTAGLQSGQPSATAYVMVESTAAYFEAYYHVLKTLQREEMEDIPFTPYLLHLEPRVSPPSYLLRRKGGDEYDFKAAFPNICERLGRSSIRVLQPEWPSGWADSLDKSQQDALKLGLTKELAIIQGPPGTGKTFLGLLLVKLLLANLTWSPGYRLNRAFRMRAEEDVPVNHEEEYYTISGPILVICYTNHALDQFLEGIYQNGETDLIRIGGRGKSEILKERNLQNLLLKQRMDPGLEISSHRRFFGQGRFQKDNLESEIHKCIDSMGANLVTEHMLEGVATQEQIESLFSLWQRIDKHRSSNDIVKVWLTQAWCVVPYMAHRFLHYSNKNEPQLRKSGWDNESASVEESAEKPLRGRMKVLPKSDADSEDGEWTEVRRRRAPRRVAQVTLDVPPEQFQISDHEDRGGEHDGGPIDEETPLQDFVDATDLWQLNLTQRRKLHEYWLAEIRMNCRRQLTILTQEYEDACKNLTEVENEIQLSLLRKSKVVGMTTTAAAKHHDVLKSLNPEIVIVEEAAEVLEGHILASLGPSVRHLILIGDHLQLRPSVAVYRLSTEHKLDVSLFERLVRSGVEHVTLQEQRRMRPNISKLVRSLYPKLRDHESVTQYQDVSGVMKNVFFFDHKSGEDNSRDAYTASKVNSTEAKLVVELCRYLLNQGCYGPKNIAILSMYTGQLQEIKTLLRQRSHSRFSVGHSTQDPGAEEPDLLPRVSSVDDYQGEECDIIILSLVRSNNIETSEGAGNIGFLKSPNRICVALTRAKKGLFIFGNADLLAERSTLWKQVTNCLRDDTALGAELELYCQNHPDIITRISKAEDFKQVEDGGCSLPCEYQLECGHVCPRRCHPGTHDLVVCPKPCLRAYEECGHICNLRCHGPAADCPPCTVIVTKQLLHCEHKQAMDCSKDLRDEVCRSACPLDLACGHQCRKLCGRPCTESCWEKVSKMLPCGHSARVSCHQNLETYCCEEPCVALLPDCQHHCKGSCGKCKRGTAHIPCQQKCGRILPCGHLCEAGCSLNCPPCPKRCRKRCFHSRCPEPCGNLCTPCQEPCPWHCEHHRCDKRCHEVCTRPRCDLPCPKPLTKCGHRCIGLCGEPCPTKCRVCHPETVDIITRMTLEEYEETDLFIQLEDCSHLFEVSGLDIWMDADETAEHSDGSVAIKLKECPECRTPIWRTHRYSNVVNKKHSQLEEVKKKLLGHERTRQGNILLEQGDRIGALSAFRQALQQNPGLMEAHFGAGCAFFAGREYGKAVIHLSFIVGRSSFAPTLARLIESAHDQNDGHGVGFIEKFYGRSATRAGASLTIQAIVQWASALTQRREFTNAIELCDSVLGRDPENRLAAEVKEKAEKGEVQLVVQAMAAEVGEKGHWYTCPNGHYYTIGECGGATMTSRCPDCKAAVGGGSHKLLEGNRHSNIDGSLQSSWPGN